MVLDGPHLALQPRQLKMPIPELGQLRLRVCACAVRRTDLDVIDADLTQPKLPLVLGHEIIGRVDALGPGVERFSVGQRLGVPWLGWSCVVCEWCWSVREILCPQVRFTGYQIDRGCAHHAVADARYCFAIPDGYSDAAAAPLMCAGLIGHRTLRMAGAARRIGLHRFGAAAHITAQVARQRSARSRRCATAGSVVRRCCCPAERAARHAACESAFCGRPPSWRCTKAAVWVGSCCSHGRADRAAERSR
jgi:propanol-preferring alcohol dehydrogenase